MKELDEAIQILTSLRQGMPMATAILALLTKAKSEIDNELHNKWTEGFEAAESEYPLDSRDSHY